jgi:hypothetical protein
MAKPMPGPNARKCFPGLDGAADGLGDGEGDCVEAADRADADAGPDPWVAT